MLTQAILVCAEHQIRFPSLNDQTERIDLCRSAYKLRMHFGTEGSDDHRRSRMLRRATDELERAVRSFMPPQPGSLPTFCGNTLHTNRNEATLSLERHERNWQ
jgi:hypothetical protein